MQQPRLRFNGFNDEWETSQIKSLLKIKSGKSQKKIECNKGKYPILATGGVIGRTNTFIYDKESVLIGRKGTINRPQYMNKPFWTVDTLFYSQIKSNNNGKFIFNLFRTINWLKYNTSTGVPSLTSSNIESIVVSYPATLEQTKIGEFFNHFDKLIELQSSKLEHLRRLKKGYLQKMFTSGDDVPRLRFKGFNDEWKQVTIDDVADYRRGSFPQPYGDPRWYDNNGYSFVQVVDVDSNFKLVKNTKRKISKLATENSVFAPKGTVLITIQGSIGRIAITQYDAYVDRTLLVINYFKKSMYKYFFIMVMSLIFNVKKQSAPGGTIKTITKKELSAFSFKMPSLSEQQRIGSFFNKLDKLIELQSSKLEHLKKDKKAYLQKMFI